MQEKVEGIILSETPYKETSKILNILTKEYGLIGVVAKGAKSLKSALRVGTELYTYGYFYIYYKENKLSLLTQVDIIDYFTHIREDIILISYRAYLSELTYQVLKQNSEAEVFNLLINALKKINDGLDPLILTNIIELKYLDYLGIGLDFDHCIKCGNNKDIVTLAADSGGYICKNCYQEEEMVNPKTIRMIRMYYYVDIASITSIKVTDIVKREINTFLTNYYDKYTGLYVKSKEFLNKLIFN